ncbi:MAG: HAD family hydrolase [Deltaproteobacteria bacterium]|nr:HAD family hydrolase [Deltaproteobacteria bacterium]
MKTKKTVCVFDFDGTLVDSMGDFAELAGRLISGTYGLSLDEGKEAYIRTSGLPFLDQLEMVFPGDPRNGETARAFEEEKKKEYFSKNLFDQVPETLSYLREKGMRVAISSSNHQELVEEFLSKKGIRFDLVLGWRPNFSKGKEHFEHIQKYLKTSSDGILFIGDSLKDAERAAHHQVDFIGKTGTFKASDFQKNFPQFQTIEELSELKGILGEVPL